MKICDKSKYTNSVNKVLIPNTIINERSLLKILVYVMLDYFSHSDWIEVQKMPPKDNENYYVVRIHYPHQIIWYSLELEMYEEIRAYIKLFLNQNVIEINQFYYDRSILQNERLAYKFNTNNDYTQNGDDIEFYTNEMEELLNIQTKHQTKLASNKQVWKLYDLLIKKLMEAKY